MIEQGLLDFSTLNSSEAVESFVEIMNAYIYQKDVFQKEIAQSFLKSMSKNLKSENSSPFNKFYTMSVLHEFIIKPDLKMISLLSGSPLFATLQQIAAIDPRKPVAQKGKNEFRSNFQKGNQLIRLCLETLIYLGKKYPTKSSNNEPTKFKRVLLGFQEQKVVMPENLVYYEAPKSRKPKVVEPEEKEKQKKGSNLESLLAFTNFKIDEYMKNLDEDLSVEEMQEEILNKHNMLMKEEQKYDKLGDAIYECPQQKVNEFLNIKEFIQSEKRIFDKHIVTNGEYDIYFSELKMAFEKIYGKGSIPQPPKVEKSSLKPTQSKVEKQQIKKEQEKERIKPVQSGIAKNKSSARGDPATSSLMAGLISRFEQKSKSPQSGFRNVKESLEKEKKMIQIHPPRNKQNKKTKGSAVASSIFTRSVAKVTGIFANPPNPTVSHKNYEGELVRVGNDLQKILFDIKKDQGIKRFKLGNLKDKYPLFENDSLQIGFKSQPVFEEVQNFEGIIMFELFFGNKQNRDIHDFQLFFEGDNTFLIYTNPQEAPSKFQAGKQLKFQVLVIPKEIPFGFVNIKFSYRCGVNYVHASAALPNSILKLTSMRSIGRMDFKEYWSNLNHFRLSHHIQPNSLPKYLTSLNELTSYSDFSMPGSTMDYELCSIFDIKNTYEGILKICVRPDLQVIIQIGAADPSEDCCKYLKFYLQCLQMVLEENG